MALSNKQKAELVAFANEIRKETLLCIANLGVGHIGGSLSIADILAYLYGKEMKIDPKNPAFDKRDQLVLSKGHSGPALYATLAIKGFFPKEWLLTLNRGGTNLPSHCDRTKTPGIDMTTGSLGQGLSAATGMALANKFLKKRSRVFVIIGDGETQEGQNWEAAMSAAKLKLGNLFAFTDNNKMQIDGKTSDVCKVEDLRAKWTAFGWDVYRVNGHNFNAIDEAVQQAKTVKSKPHMIILDTIKGKGGGKRFENQVSSHNANLTLEEANTIIKEVLNA